MSRDLRRPALDTPARAAILCIEQSFVAVTTAIWEILDYGWYDQIRQDGSYASIVLNSTERRPINLSTMRDMLDKVLAGQPNLALLLTEFGADWLAGFDSRSRNLWSEEYHADLLSDIFALADKFPDIVGTFPFCFSDYRDPSKIHNGYWNGLNLKGLVDYGRRTKKAYDAEKKTL